MRKWLSKRKFDCIILDEAHRIKNRKASVSKNILALSKDIPQRLALTGTPAHNAPWELYNIIHFLKPQQYKSYWKWLDQWFEFYNKWTPNGTVKEPKRIKPSLRTAFSKELSTFCIQRKRKDVMDWNTNDDIIDIPLPLNSQQKKYIKDIEMYFNTADTDTEVESSSVLDSLIKVRQICNTPEVLGLKGKSPKFEWIKQYIKDNPEHSIIIFSNQVKSLLILNKLIPNSQIIYGKVKPRDRQVIVQNFQAKKFKVILCQTQACKEGLTLDVADVTIFLDIYPPAADYLQAKDRAVATSAERAHTNVVYRLMMKDSFDEVMYKLVDTNIRTSDVVNNFKNYIGGKHGIQNNAKKTEKS